MKAKVLSVVAVLMATLAFGQGKYGATPEDSIECITNLSLYQEFVKQKNYNDARAPRMKACEICPKSSKNLYLNGVKMYRQFIKDEQDAAAKEKLIDTLLMTYDQRIANFGQEGYVLGRKGSDMLKYRKADPVAARDALKKSIELQGKKSEAGALAAYYQSLYLVYKKDKEQKAALLEEYLPVMEIVDHNIVNPKNEKTKTYYEKSKNNIDEIFMKIGQCPDIEEIIKKKLEADPDNMEVKKKAMALMGKRECTDSDLYLKVVEAVHGSEPSHESAYGIGIMKLKKNEYSGALKYFKQAIDLCTDCTQKGDYYLAAAQCANKTGQRQSAYNYANQAISNGGDKGKAYLIMSQAIAGSAKSCGSNELEQKAVYWLAYDYAAKAKSNGASQGSKLMSAYKAQWPNKTLQFNHGVLGKESYNIGCWINQSTAIRLP